MYNSLFSRGGLSLERLKTLLEVHAAGSIARAAPSSSSKQSQFSRQITELSEFFGADLTRRSSKNIEFTETGEKLVDMARRHLSELVDFQAACSSLAVEYKLGAGEGALQWLLIPRLKPNIASGQKTSFATFNLRTRDIIRQLQDERLHFGVLRNEGIPSGLRCVKLGVVHHVGVVPHTLSAKAPSLAEFFGSIPLAVMATDGQFTANLREKAVAAGTILSTALACQSYPQALSAVHSGCYGAVLPEVGVRALPKSIHHFVGRKELSSMDRDLVLAWNPRTIRVRPNGRAVLEFLSRELVF